MFAPMAHFSLSEVIDPKMHRAENELQELYHRPELLSQPGVVWGDRWVHDPECKAASAVRRPDFALHYAAMYWLRAPAHQNSRGFLAHFARAAQLGLDSAHSTQTSLDAFMVPLKGYVRQDRLVTAEALPFRPMKGVYLVVSRLLRHQDVDAEAVFHWYDQMRIPDMMECPGAAGAWTFASRRLFSPSGDLTKPILRIQLFYLDSDPIAFAGELAGRALAWANAGRARDTSQVEEILFSGPLRTIIPWRACGFEPGREA